MIILTEWVNTHHTRVQGCAVGISEKHIETLQSTNVTQSYRLPKLDLAPLFENKLHLLATFLLRYGYVLVTIWLRKKRFGYVLVANLAFLVTIWLRTDQSREQFGYARFGYDLVTMWP